jgi:D-cysteine desulfhydrase
VLAPLGGTDPWTTLGWVNAAFELLSQVVPEAVYVALGSGGTAAGLALGFALAGAPVRVRAVRITSAVIANARRVRSLAEATARVLGVPCPALPLDILHGYVGRGYGHPLPAAERARSRVPVRLDSTYTAKAALAFLEGPERTRVFWLTFAP